MNLESDAIVISLRKFQENKQLLSCFTRDYGVVNGLFRPAVSKKLRQPVLLGDIGYISWYSRLESQLGTIHIEVMQHLSAGLHNDRLKLMIMQNILSMIKLFMTERDPHAKVYNHCYFLLGSLSKLSNLEAIKFYCQFELVLLDEIGFGLSLDKCVVTNGTDNLIYVSPKSGCAVGAISGRPYHDKLLALPDMLLNKHNPGSKSEVLQALKLTGFFIHRVLSEMHHKVRLQARDQLITCLSLAEDL